MNAPATTVVYRSYSLRESLRVSRIQYPEGVEDWAPKMRGLIERGYTAAFEEPRGHLPAGTVATRYGAEHDAAFTARALDHHGRGSQYWTIRAGGALLVFAKVTPGEVLDEPMPGVVYVNDIVVEAGSTGHTFQSHQRKGYASAVLHAALKFGGHDPHRPVVLEAFDASEDRMVNGRLVAGPNQLYRNMGLERVGSADPFGFPNGAELWMSEFRTPAGFALDGAVHALERY